MSLSRIELSVWALTVVSLTVLLLAALSPVGELVCALTRRRRRVDRSGPIAFSGCAQTSADTHGHGSGHGPSALPFPRSPRDILTKKKNPKSIMHGHRIRLDTVYINIPYGTLYTTSQGHETADSRLELDFIVFYSTVPRYLVSRMCIRSHIRSYHGLVEQAP